MELNSIINDDDLSMKMQDIYKFIDKNEDKIDEIINRVYNDIKNIFKDITLNSNGIEIINLGLDNVINDRNRCHTVLLHHSREVLQDNSYLMSYAFKINVVNDTITITKKH